LSDVVYWGGQRGKKLGIIRIRSFSQTTSDTVKEKLQELEKSGESRGRHTFFGTRSPLNGCDP
jgi:C-terminal processing protease CtpA/Prc